MKCILCVCLFLSSIVSPQAKTLHEQYLKIQEDLKKLKKEEIKYVDSLKWNEETLDLLEQKFDGYKIYLNMMQCDVEVEIESLDDDYDLYVSLSKKNKKYKKEIESIRAKIQHNKEQLDLIEQKQLELFINNDDLELNDQGNPNDQAKIQGNKNLPVFGSIQNTVDSKYACLTYKEIESTSTYFEHPLPNSRVSAGTWAYPNGKMHLGIDFACDMYSKVFAPANGLVLYADAPVEDDNGYIGNMCGWPYGGGNTICMVVSVNNQLYGISFNHLSSQIYVVAGQLVSQNDVIALSGNSGNSSGPHCHIECFELNCTLEQIVVYFQQTADFSFGTGWSEPATCSQYACRIQPETIWG